MHAQRTAAATATVTAGAPGADARAVRAAGAARRGALRTRLGWALVELGLRLATPPVTPLAPGAAR
ncbi:hypothetical protein GUY61_16855 [Streptomyces sp. GC420]|nr:hypothetical protein [Streptomyces sp. GC420]